MFKQICLLTCLLLSLGTASHAQDKPEPRYKPWPVKGAEEGASASAKSAPPTKTEDATKAPRAILARPPQSGPEPMLKLGAKNKPYTELIYHTYKLDYYDCDGIVAPWFRELVVAEMNYFAELAEMPFVKGDACVVSIGTEHSLTPGRISIHLYTNKQRLSDCVRSDSCPAFRSVNLIPKNKVIYRSYFLSDMSRKLIAQYCVTDKGKLHTDTTCYAVP